MRKLPPTFNKYGYTFKLIVRSQFKAIYGQYMDEALIAYEIIKIRVRPPRYNHFLNREEPATEIYPSTSQWSKMGWTSWPWERALRKYNQI